MPYFADRGYDTYAISFRCQGSSDMQHDAKFAGTLESHSADIQHFVTTLPKPPVILAHSLGGLIAQRCACKKHQSVKFVGALSVSKLILCEIIHCSAFTSRPPAGQTNQARLVLAAHALHSFPCKVRLPSQASCSASRDDAKDIS